MHCSTKASCLWHCFFCQHKQFVRSEMNIQMEQLMQHWNRMAAEQNVDLKRQFCKQYMQHAIEKLHHRVRHHRLHILPVQGPGSRHRIMLSLPYVQRLSKNGKPCTVLSKVSFDFQVREVCDVRRSWARLQENHLGTDETKYYFLLPLLLEGTPNCREPHLKRQDRFRVVAFCFANGISPSVLREWLWASGLLQTSDLDKTQKRWVHVESMFAQFEYFGIEGNLPSTYTSWDMRRQQKVNLFTGEAVKKKTFNMLD